MSAIFEPHKAENPIPGSLILAIFFAIVLPFFIGSMLFIAKMNSKPARKRSATVLVLGDVGRSPRIMYHAESLAKHGWETSLVGYHGAYH
jgi:beta-1,4-mannosyltransferase